jgi:ribose-phosphate pyrophosphokinase
LLSKTRPEKEQVAITAVNGDVAHKKILLVDDIISTGRTLAECSHALAKLGATSVSAAATHGVFSPGSYELLEQSPLEKITVTNTIAEHKRGKIAIVDTSPFIQKIILAH